MDIIKTLNHYIANITQDSGDIYLGGMEWDQFILFFRTKDTFGVIRKLKGEFYYKGHKIKKWGDDN